MRTGAGGPAGTWTTRTPSAPVDDLGQVGRVAAGEDVDLVAARGEVPRDLADVDVLAAAVDAAEHREGRGVLADQGDPPLMCTPVPILAGATCATRLGGRRPSGRPSAERRLPSRGRSGRCRTAPGAPPAPSPSRRGLAGSASSSRIALDQPRRVGVDVARDAVLDRPSPSRSSPGRRSAGRPSSPRSPPGPGWCSGSG